MLLIVINRVIIERIIYLVKANEPLSIFQLVGHLSYNQRQVGDTLQPRDDKRVALVQVVNSVILTYSLDRYTYT